MTFTGRVVTLHYGELCHLLPNANAPLATSCWHAGGKTLLQQKNCTFDPCRITFNVAASSLVVNTHHLYSYLFNHLYSYLGVLQQQQQRSSHVIPLGDETQFSSATVKVA